MVYRKVTEGLLPLRRQKTSKNHKKSRMKIEKLYEANRYWNDWKFQLHWHKLEWVNPKIKIKGGNPIQFLQISLDRTSH